MSRLPDAATEPADAMAAMWADVRRPELRPFERLFFECYARGAQGEQPFARMLPGAVESWLAEVGREDGRKRRPRVRAARAGGHPRPAARSGRHRRRRGRRRRGPGVRRTAAPRLRPARPACPRAARRRRRPRPRDLSGRPKSTSVTPSSCQRASFSGSGLKSRATICGAPSRPAAAQVSCSSLTGSSMSKSRGVVIQPSADRAIHLKFFSVPAAPTSTGIWDWTGLGHAHDGPNLTNSPSNSASSCGPQRAHGLDVLAQHGAPPTRGDVVVGEFVCVPTESDAEADPATGQVVEGGDRLGQRDRVVLDGQCDRRRQPHPRGHRARGAQRHPRVEGAHVAVVGQRLVAGGRVGGLPLDRDMGVFGHVERREPVVVGQFGGRRRIDPTIAGEQNEPIVHTQN